MTTLYFLSITATIPYEWDQFDFTYSAVGIYTIMVIAANELGNTTKYQEIHVQDSVQLFTVTSNYPQEFINGGKLTFSIALIFIYKDKPCPCLSRKLRFW